jgi:hypothetical protein
VPEEEAVVEYNNTRRIQHMNRFPINDNLMSLIFIVLADLNETQRERMTSTLTLRGRTVQTYTFDSVREIFIELFCAPKSSLENPNLRASGGGNERQRNFCVIESGDLEGNTGYWVEDDESGEVGFVPEFEDTFWIFDDVHEVWASKHFKGRTMRRGNPKGGGKGKGYKGFKKFVPFWKKKGKGGGKGDKNQSQEASANLAKGKSKGNGKKGKSKGKGKADSKGESGKTWIAEESETVPTSSALAAPAAETWWQSEWSEDTTWNEASFFVTAEEKDKSHSYLTCWDRLDLKTNPTFAVLDLGCTKAMASRYAINLFVKEAGKYGITWEYLPSSSRFSFANSAEDVVSQKIRIWLPTNPPCSTDFDILETGNVPILISLPQMRNLYFNLELCPEAAYLTCAAFGFNREAIRTSTTRHLIVDLAAICHAPVGKYNETLSVFM